MRFAGKHRNQHIWNTISFPVDGIAIFILYLHLFISPCTEKSIVIWRVCERMNNCVYMCEKVIILIIYISYVASCIQPCLYHVYKAFWLQILPPPQKKKPSVGIYHTNFDKLTERMWPCFALATLTYCFFTWLCRLRYVLIFYEFSLQFLFSSLICCLVFIFLTQPWIYCIYTHNIVQRHNFRLVCELA